MSGIPKVTHRGIVKIGDIEIPCAVLDNKMRVLSERGMNEAVLGRVSGAAFELRRQSKNQEDPIPFFLAPNQLRDFITSEMIHGPLARISYKNKSRIVTGFSAEALPVVCDIWLQARACNKLSSSQQERAMKAEILMRSLAKIGIVALIDEATGYYFEKEKDELQLLLSKYLRAEHAKWVKTFPDVFFKEIYRLKNWKKPEIGHHRPPEVGKIINKYVYEMMPEGTLEELRRLNPVDFETGRRQYKHHQYFKSEGHIHLKTHLLQVIALMSAVEDWEGFEKIFRKFSENIKVYI